MHSLSRGLIGPKQRPGCVQVRKCRFAREESRWICASGVAKRLDYKVDA